MMLQPSRMSRWLAPFAKILAAFLVCITAIYWLMPESAEYTARRMATLPSGQISLSLNIRLLGLLLSSIQVLLLVYALLAVSKVFRAFANNEWFVPQIGEHLHKFGWALALYGATSPLVRTLMALLITWNNPPGQQMLLINFSGDDFVIALVGVLILLLGYAMREAARIADENDQII
jgi:Protein of unknown function (DUF2975)